MSDAPLGMLGPASVFDSVAYRRDPGLGAVVAEHFDVVAGPGEPPSTALQQGDVLVVRALGEGGLGTAFALAGGYLDDAESVGASGYATDGTGDGWYAYVEPRTPTTAHLARRVLGPDGRLPPDRLLLRPRVAETVPAPCGCRGTASRTEDHALPEAVAPTPPVCTPAGEPDPTGRGPHPLIRRGSNRPSVGYAQTCLNAWMTKVETGEACVDNSAATRAFVTDAFARLKAAGQSPLVVDCRFGQHTDRATRAFQACKAVVRDGKIGPITWPLLKAYDPGATPVPPASAVDLSVEPATFVAAVGKPHTAPPRTRIVLRSSAPLTTPVVLTRSSSASGPTVRLFTAATGGTEITFNGTANVFPGAGLTPGLELFAEGTAPSPTPDDFTLTLAHQSAGTPGAPGTAKGTAVALTLDVALTRVTPGADPPFLSEGDRVAGGRAVQVADGSMTHERALVVLRPPEPAGAAVTVVVTATDGRLRLFEREGPAVGQVPITTPHTVPAASIPPPGLRLFVEAAAPSTAARDAELRVAIRDIAPDVDRVPMTAVQVAMVADATAAAPPLTSVRFGLWDRAYDAAGDVLNGVAEADNFVARDRRKFHLRVKDAAAGGSSVTANWRTLRADGRSDDDAPADARITLPERAAGTHEFVSRAVMLVTNNTDRAFPTNSGLAAPFDVGDRAAGQSNHRTRRARIDGFTRVEYAPQAGVRLGVTLPVFQRTPTDERRRIPVRVVRYTNAGTPGFPVASPGEIAGQFGRANDAWNAVGIQIDAQAATDRAVPAAALDASGGYPGGANSPHEQAVLADLVPATPDSTVTVVFVHASATAGFNAYATVAERSPIPNPAGPVSLGDRSFIFVRPGLDLNNETLAHELHHVLFNRFDGAVDRQFLTFNTNPPDSFGLTLPDVRVVRRVHNRHAPDPNSDAANENVVNWARRTRTTRFPIAGSVDPGPDATTGNVFHRPF